MGSPVEATPTPLRFLKNLRRTGEIAAVFINHGFGDLVDRIGLTKYLNWGRRKLSKDGTEKATLTRGERIRLALETLGPTFVKFGQVLSTRPDLIPADIVSELRNLQEHVPAFPDKVAVETIERALKKPINECFAYFETKCLASGSLGQVHAARLHDGSNVVVKVRRPRVVQEVDRDVALMHELAAVIQKRIPEAEVFDPVNLVRNFERTINRELNFLREARTIDEFRRMFENDASLYVPLVFSDFCSEDVLVMERIDGYRVDDVATIPPLAQRQKEIARNGARIIMKQAFEFGMFHGDPHPGNFRIQCDGSICLLDYGMVGTLEEKMREQIVDIFVAIANNDYRKSSRTVLRIGQPLSTVDERQFMADYRDFVDSYYGLPLEKFDVSRLLTDFVTLLATHRIRCPSDLMLLIRALIHLDAVGRTIAPGFNLAEEMIPYFKRLLRDRYRPGYLWERLRQEAGEFARIAHEIPMETADLLKKFNRNELGFNFQLTGMNHMITELDRSSNRIVVGLIIAASILSSSILIRSGSTADWFSIPIYILSILLGVWLIYGIFRSGRL
ncbi:AarF/ABC1/UbiB kinase family protein [bacterium]|nr:AarF/ABC1/UbiB kinase family protein [bacterium]